MSADSLAKNAAPSRATAANAHGIVIDVGAACCQASIKYDHMPMPTIAAGLH